MQKKILLLSISIFISFIAYSQNIGIKAGLNYVNNIMDPNTNGVNDNNSFRIAYHFGIYGKFFVEDKFFIQPELLYSNKGLTFDETSSTSKANLHLNYINLPVLFGYQLTENFVLAFGPELGYLVSAKSKFDSQTTNVDEIWNNKFDFGLAIALEYNLSEKFNLGLRYTHGLTSVIKDIGMTDEIGNPIGEANARNRSFQLSIGYRIK
ncbi:MAG: porin family protein [Reichenbachiella sp.]|uniref:porin family protein n=1 Tax=Reichenbachiella sp. TaxID=2184521 RepID=UPI003296ADD4